MRTLLTQPPVGSTNLGTTPSTTTTTVSAFTSTNSLVIQGGQPSNTSSSLDHVPEQIAEFEAKAEAMEKEESLKYRHQSLREAPRTLCALY
jgi:phage shock protein A